MDFWGRVTCTRDMRHAKPSPPPRRDLTRARQEDSRDQTLIVVQNEWNGCRTAWVRFVDLEDVHWFQPAGAPRSLIHARICCDSIVKGHLPHDCKRTAHRLIVCVLKCHTDAVLFEELVLRANALMAGARRWEGETASRER
jgi:hypothetical protein